MQIEIGYLLDMQEGRLVKIFSFQAHIRQIDPYIELKGASLINVVLLFLQ